MGGGGGGGGGTNGYAYIVVVSKNYDYAGCQHTNSKSAASKYVQIEATLQHCRFSQFS